MMPQWKGREKAYHKEYMREYRQRRKEQVQQLWETLFFIINTQMNVIRRMPLPEDPEDFQAIVLAMHEMIQRVMELNC